jgi:hypothetical protein
MRTAAILLVPALFAAPAAAQQAPPTPVPQNVVVPSLPGEKNKEGVVKPSGALASDSAGWVKNDPAAIDPNAAPPAPAGGAAAAPSGPGVPRYSALPPPATAPSGKPVINAAYVSLRGVVKALDKGKSITIVDASGRERTVPLVPNAELYDGLAVGDRVVLRLPLDKPADGKSADHVEKEKPKKDLPKSKFSKAQTPAG